MQIQQYLLDNLECGKSTLTNKILGERITREGEISKKNKRGKNTTTDITLYEIAKDSFLLDTPGFQTIDIFEIESKDLCEYFRDFKPYIKNCEYIGCSHIKEQSCGIKQAVSQGKIQNERYESYIKIYNELKDREEHKW